MNDFMELPIGDAFALDCDRWFELGISELFPVVMGGTLVDYLDELIARSARATGGQDELAKRLGISVDQLATWANGKQECSPEIVAMIAHHGGYDPVAWMARAVLHHNRRAAHYENLRDALRGVVNTERTEKYGRWRAPKAVGSGW